ncbi:ABC transporter substrate-binding protein [Bacillus piscicola]|uniref:ABC transporter substrate-binding protein n=1 Tax=Bacillus piscicola TaxID=1632684 RepID=UPI001F0959F1|nr:ABC transporter substrate-binding protein [Bacillus piscicola]
MLKKRWFLFFMIVGVLLVGCNTEGEKVEEETATAEPAQEAEQQKAEGETVAVENYDRTLHFDSIPERVVSTNEHTTETLLKLGLEEKLVGVVQREGRELLPEFQEEFDELNILGSDNPSLEVLLDVSPDFVYGRESSFAGKEGIATVEELKDFGIQTYIDTDSYQEGTTMEDVYQDIINLGRVFDVEDRANEIVSEMKDKSYSIQKQVGDVQSPPRVLVFDQGGDEVFTAGKGSLQSTLITMAGGENIFSDIDKTWARVSWEEVVARDPEIIVINDYGNTTAEEKIKELKKNPSMSDVAAVKKERFVIIDLDSMFAGIRNIDALETLAKGFYPEQFD